MMGRCGFGFVLVALAIFSFPLLIMLSGSVAAHPFGLEVKFEGKTESLQTVPERQYIINFVRVTEVRFDYSGGSLDSGKLVAVQWFRDQGSQPIADKGIAVEVYGEWLGDSGQGWLGVYLELPFHYLRPTTLGQSATSTNSATRTTATFSSVQERRPLDTSGWLAGLILGILAAALIGASVMRHRASRRPL